MSSLVNKVKEALHSDNKTSQPEGTHGTHNSRTANAADPRIDSDLDHRGAAGSHNANYSSNDNYAFGDSQAANRTTGPTTTTDGPHSSNLANKADPRVDSDRDYGRNLGANPHGTATTSTTQGTTHGTTHGTTGTTGAYGTAGNTSGLNSSRHATTGTSSYGDPVSTGTTGPASSTAGPHNSDLLNKADPRVDSDFDGSRNMGLRQGGTTTGAGSGFSSGGAGTTGVRNTSGIPEGTVGPHGSRTANAVDPRVDSDLDSGRNTGLTGAGNTRTTGSHTVGNQHHGAGTAAAVGAAGTAGALGGSHGSHGTHGTTGTHGATGSHGLTGTQGSTGAYGTTGTHGTHASSGLPEGTTGPHSSRVGNAVDPRVDSDLDSGRSTGLHSGSTNTGAFGTTGTTGTHTGHTGNTNTGAFGTTGTTGAHTGAHTGTYTGTHTGTQGTHAGNANSLGGAGGIGGVGHTPAGTGPAPNTAGPHSSDMLNKGDPRIDSDLDGSKTVGGNKTFNQSNTNTIAKDPSDAAQVPPSVLQKHIGQPSIQHDDDKHDRVRRHSVSHQEKHRGL